MPLTRTSGIMLGVCDHPLLPASLLQAAATCHSQTALSALNRLPPGCLSAACRCCPGGCHPHLRHRAGRLPLPDHERHHLPQKRFSPGRPHLHVWDPHSGSSVVHVVPHVGSSALPVLLEACMLQPGAGPAAYCSAYLHGGPPLHQLRSSAIAWAQAVRCCRCRPLTTWLLPCARWRT